MVGARLLGDLHLRMMLEELAHRQVEKEHSRLEVATPDRVPEIQGIIRGTRYFLTIADTEIARREALDRPDIKA